MRRFYERLWNDWDDSDVDDTLAPGITFRGSFGTSTTGRDQWRSYRDQVRRGAPDFHNEIVDLVTDADRAAARLRYSGTHLGPLLGIPATGRRFTYSGAAFFTIADELIADVWVLGDLDTLRRQLTSTGRDAAEPRPLRCTPMPAVILAPGEGEPIAVGQTVTVLKATAETTGGAFVLGEATVAPGFAGPPAHLHREHHDAFYVLEGILTVQVGDELREAGPGAFVCIPPGVVHTFSNRSDLPARMLNVSAPGGMDDYLRDLSAAVADGPPDPRRMAGVMVKYDVVLAD